MKMLNWEAILWDCLEVMKNIPDWSIDCIITDPPYWTTACKWDTVIPFEPMWKELNRVIKKNWAIVLFGSEPFSSALRMSNIKNYKYDWIWEKSKASNFLLAKKQPLKAHENIIVFNSKLYFPQKTEWLPFNKWKRKHTNWKATDVYNKITNPDKEIINNNWLRNPRSVQYFKTAESEWKTYHWTQKPVALIEYLIKTYTNEWELVLDFTAGSFTTAVACENTNRKWICIEKDENYFNIWINRLWNVKNAETGLINKQQSLTE